MQFFDIDYSLTETTTVPILGEGVVEGTPIYEGKTEAGVKAKEDEKNHVYQDNVAYITNELTKAETDEMFNFMYDLQTTFGSEKTEDGKPYISWIDSEGNPVSFNSLDDWNKLPMSTRYKLLDDANKLLDGPTPFYLDTTLSGEGKTSYYDLITRRDNIAVQALNTKTVMGIHNGYMKQAAANADGSQKEQTKLDRFSYHAALLDENGVPVSEEQYNKIINTRYSSLISKSALIRSAVPYNFYRNQLMLEQSNPDYNSEITLKDNEAKAFNEAILNSETVFDLMNNLPQDQLGKFSNKFAYHFGLLENQDPYIKNCQTPECRQLRNWSATEYSIFIEENDLKIKTGTDEKTGKSILREPTYEELWQGLKDGKERQTYANTFSQIIEAYNDEKLSPNISKLKDRYQFTIEAGLGNAERDVPIKYEFDIDNYEDKNFATLGNIFGLLNNTYKKSSTALNEKGYKFAFDVKTDNMQNVSLNDKVSIVGNEEAVVFSADDKTKQGKYIKQIIPYMTDLIKSDDTKGSIEYREFLTNDEMQNYEVYTIKFNPKFLDSEEFNKVKFVESDEESTKIKNEIITKFKENGLTVFVPKDVAQKKLLPSRERKDALTVSPVEQAIADRGVYELNVPRAGNLKVVKDETANLWRITGNYLALNENNGKYDVIPINDSFEIKHNGKTKTPFDVDKIINDVKNMFRQTYNTNTKLIKNLNELGVNIGEDIYRYDGR